MGQIACQLNEETLSQQIFSIIDQFELRTSNEVDHVRFEVLKSLLLRLQEDYVLERLTIFDLMPIILKMEKHPEQINPFELGFTLMPPDEMISENPLSQAKMEQSMYELGQPAIFERDNLLPSMPESFTIYAMHRGMVLSENLDLNKCHIYDEGVQRLKIQSLEFKSPEYGQFFHRLGLCQSLG